MADGGQAGTGRQPGRSDVDGLGLEIEYEARSAEKRLLKNSFGLLLLLILATLTVLSLVDESGWGITLVTFMLASTLVLALYTSSASRRLLVAGVVVGAASVVVSLPLTPALTGFLTAFGSLWVVFTVLATLIVLRAIMRLDRVDAQAILGVVSVYLLLGLAFMLLYSTIGRAQEGVFFAEQAGWTTSELVYFSYVTLTTLGYGDLTPATEFGRYAAVLEAVVGQVFLVVVVARFVSLWGKELPDLPTRAERRAARRGRSGDAQEEPEPDPVDESADGAAADSAED
jgi:hypothetical protein